MVLLLLEAVTFKSDKKGSFILLLPLVYFVSSFLFIFTNAQHFSFNYDVQKALPFALMSIVFYKLWPVINLKKLLTWFCNAMLLYALIALLRAAINVLLLESLSPIFYAELSFFNHPGYVAIAYCLCFILANYSSLSPRINYIVKLVSIAMVYLLSAKIAWLILAILFLCWVLKLLKQKKFLKIGGSILVVLVCFSLSKLSKLQENRLAEMTNSIGSEQQTGGSTGVRMAIWKSFFQNIESFSLLGEGRIKGEQHLTKIYANNNIDRALEDNLNAHNQWIQTYVFNGLLALVILLLTFLLVGFKTKSLDAALLLLTMALFLSIESALLRQVGQNLLILVFAATIYIVERKKITTTI